MILNKPNCVYMKLHISLIELERAQMSVNEPKCWYGRIFWTDAENTFSSINRKVMLHKLKFIAPSLLLTKSIVM